MRKALLYISRSFVLSITVKHLTAAFILAVLPALSLAACPIPTPDKLADLDRYATARFNVAQALRTGAAQANDQCFWKVDYTLLPAKRPVTLYLSPDGKYAAPALFDLSVDPAKERAERAEAARKLLTGSSAPDPKTGVKPTSLVIFSDYECPFCQRLDAMMHDPSIAEHLKTVDVQFRNFPLSMHPWAKQAALAGACVQRQNPARLAEVVSPIGSRHPMWKPIFGWALWSGLRVPRQCLSTAFGNPPSGLPNNLPRQ